MRRMIACTLLLGLLPGGALAAQDADTLRAVSGWEPLSAELVREIADLYNAPGTVRVSGSLEVAAERTVTGDIAIIGGPALIVAGRVTGRIVAVNADVVLRPGAQVDGDILVVGGRVEGRDEARVAGEVRVYRQSMSYHMEGERLVPDRQRVDEPRTFGRIYNLGARTVSQLSFTATPYNRVEGLPVHVGPTLTHHARDADVRIEVQGILRSVGNFEWTPDNVGHRVFAEVRLAQSRGFGIGGTLFDVVEPVERWHLKDTEAALAAFFLHRDFRDHYARHGGGVHLSMFAGDERSLTLGYRDERWRSRTARDPFTLFRDDQAWRPNPLADEGTMRLLTAEYRYDTRNDAADPWAGWLLTADIERGTGRLRALVDRDLPPGGGTSDAAPVTYVRGFADLRRYNRLSPDAQLNMRVVLGGWLGGDDLPLQRRLSVGGPGTLPGFDHRAISGAVDVGQCGGVVLEASPALCERVILAQIEYRGALGFGRIGLGDLVPDWWSYYGLKAPQWVAFADAGRGWLVGDRVGTLQYPASTLLPSLETFRTDVGLGLDLRVLGFFVAKAVSDRNEPANFFVRVRHRF